MTDPTPPSVPPPPSRKRRGKRGGKAPEKKPTPKRSAGGRPGAWARAIGGYPKLTTGVLAALGTLAAAAGALLLGFGALHGPKGTGAVRGLDWPADLGPEEAAALLAREGLVRSADAMVMFLRASGGTADFVPGPHLLFEGASPWELRRMLARSLLRPITRVTFPEGWNRFDMAARLEKHKIAGRRAFLAATTDAALLDELKIDRATAESAEGYLFPATYTLSLDTDPRDVVRKLVAEADQRWEAALAERKAGLEALRGSLGWGRREVLTLASIVEKEAAVDDERPVIASVFLNRLLDPAFHPKRLQSDPTAAYGCLVAPGDAPSCADFAGKPTPAINRDPKNRYSTYARAGLPPGPIANPGARSIEAVLGPASTRFLYFVARGGGRHTFSETLDAHNEAVHHGGNGANAPDPGLHPADVPPAILPPERPRAE